MIYDKRIKAKVKGKVYKTVVRPAMLYGLETVTLTKKKETGHRTRSGRAEDAKVLLGSDKDDDVPLYRRYSTGCTTGR